MLAALETIGIKTFILQHGSYRPTDLQQRVKASSLSIDAFAYADDLDARMRQADLVISHAGAGSILTALRGTPFATEPQAALPLIIVPNASLMDDHQSELAQELSASGLAVLARADASSLAAAVRSLAASGPASDLHAPTARLADLLDEL